MCRITFWQSYYTSLSKILSCFAWGGTPILASKLYQWNVGGNSNKDVRTCSEKFVIPWIFLSPSFFSKALWSLTLKYSILCVNTRLCTVSPTEICTETSLGLSLLWTRTVWQCTVDCMLQLFTAGYSYVDKPAQLQVIPIAQLVLKHLTNDGCNPEVKILEQISLSWVHVHKYSFVTCFLQTDFRLQICQSTNWIDPKTPQTKNEEITLQWE